MTGGALYAEGGTGLRGGGAVDFRENTASENVSLDLEAARTNLSFTGNTAAIAGGAVYQSGTTIGLT